MPVAEYLGGGAAPIGWNARKPPPATVPATIDRPGDSAIRTGRALLGAEVCKKEQEAVVSGIVLRACHSRLHWFRIRFENGLEEDMSTPRLLTLLAVPPPERAAEAAEAAVQRLGARQCSDAGSRGSQDGKPPHAPTARAPCSSSGSGSASVPPPSKRRRRSGGGGGGGGGAASPARQHGAQEGSAAAGSLLQLEAQPRPQAASRAAAAEPLPKQASDSGKARCSGLRQSGAAAAGGRARADLEPHVRLLEREVAQLAGCLQQLQAGRGGSGAKPESEAAPGDEEAPGLPSGRRPRQRRTPHAGTAADGARECVRRLRHMYGGQVHDRELLQQQRDVEALLRVLVEAACCPRLERSVRDGAAEVLGMAAEDLAGLMLLSQDFKFDNCHGDTMSRRDLGFQQGAEPWQRRLWLGPSWLPAQRCPGCGSALPEPHVSADGSVAEPNAEASRPACGCDAAAAQPGPDTAASQLLRGIAQDTAWLRRLPAAAAQQDLRHMHGLVYLCSLLLRCYNGVPSLEALATALCGWQPDAAAPGPCRQPDAAAPGPCRQPRRQKLPPAEPSEASALALAFLKPQGGSGGVADVLQRCCEPDAETFGSSVQDHTYAQLRLVLDLLVAAQPGMWLGPVAPELLRRFLLGPVLGFMRRSSTCCSKMVACLVAGMILFRNDTRVLFLAADRCADGSDDGSDDDAAPLRDRAVAGSRPPQPRQGQLRLAVAESLVQLLLRATPERPGHERGYGAPSVSARAGGPRLAHSGVESAADAEELKLHPSQFRVLLSAAAATSCIATAQSHPAIRSMLTHRARRHSSCRKFADQQAGGSSNGTSLTAALRRLWSCLAAWQPRQPLPAAPGRSGSWGGSAAGSAAERRRERLQRLVLHVLSLEQRGPAAAPDPGVDCGPASLCAPQQAALHGQPQAPVLLGRPGTASRGSSRCSAHDG